MTLHNTRRIYTFLVFALLAMMLGCEKQADEKFSAPPNSSPEFESQLISQAQLDQANDGLFNAGDAALKQTTAAAEILAKSVDTFLASPIDENLKTAQQNWQNCALAYRDFFFQKHLAIAAPNTLEQLNKLDFRIGTYPVQPGFIDAFGEYKYSGVVFDVGFALTKESLDQQHGLTDVSEVMLGIYAIDFLLHNVNTQRDPGDFIQIKKLRPQDKENGFEEIAELPNNRRRLVLQLQTEILIDDLTTLSASWQQSSPSIKQQWLTLEANEQTRLAQQTFVNALTQTLLEIGDFNTPPTEGRESAVAPTIRQANFSLKKTYILKTLQSIHAGANYFEKDTNKSIEESYSEMLETLANGSKQQTENTAEKNKDSEKEFWRDCFAQIKAIIDLVNQETT